MTPPVRLRERLNDARDRQRAIRGRIAEARRERDGALEGMPGGSTAHIRPEASRAAERAAQAIDAAERYLEMSEDEERFSLHQVAGLNGAPRRESSPSDPETMEQLKRLDAR